MGRTKTAAPFGGELQLQVMRVLWSRGGGATLAEIREDLEREHRVATTTIATVLSRLEQSGLVEYRGGPPRVYAAKVGERDVQRTQVQRVIDRLFGGRASELIAHLVRESEIDDEELVRLRRLVQERRRR